MNKTIPAGICAAVLGFGGSAAAGDLKLTVTSLANAKGNVMIAVYDGAAGFGKIEKAVAAIRLRGRGAKIAVILPGLAPGRYGVSVFHDENANQKLDTNMIGIPTEGYGFSNAARGVMGPPNFDQTALELGPGDLGATIEIQY